MTQCVIDPPRRDSYWLRPLGGRHRYRPAKGSFARFPSGASLNATMQFTLLPVGCDRLRSPPYPPCERIFCPISVGSVAQCNNAIHAPTLGTRAKSFFLGRKIHRYGTFPFCNFSIWILTGRGSQGVVVRSSGVVGQAARVPYRPPNEV